MSANDRLTFLTALVIIGLLLIYLYHEHLRPRYNIVLTKADRAHRLSTMYKKKIDDGEVIDDYNKDEVKQALYKVYEMVILELRNRPNDPALLIAIDDLEQDIDFINPIKKQLTRS